MTSPEAAHDPTTHRPTILGTRHMCSSCHYLATSAAFEILEAGGNAVDAGVCAGLVLGVVESAYVSIGGVAPIMILLRDRGEVVTISGLGTWPRAASCAYFQEKHGGALPPGILRTVVPAAVDAWMTALARYGTMPFGVVAAAAIRFAREGFVMYPLMASTLASAADGIAAWPSTAAVYLPNGTAPPVGQPFVQMPLGDMLQFLADEESAATGDREIRLAAARDAFYRGDIAATIIDFQRRNGGLLTRDDLAEFNVAVEPALRGQFGDVEVFACGPWCQGPMLLQQLGILDGMKLCDLGHNSGDYVHVVTEAINLAAEDRERFYGDPRHVDVPLEHLLSREHADEQRRLIGRTVRRRDGGPDVTSSGSFTVDTSYVCVVDRHGNAFSATPSDGVTGGPIVPELGLLVSTRGGQSWMDPRHPAAIAPGKRPRLTPNPAIAIRGRDFIMPFGTPGHDSQTQVMLQFLLNVLVFGMDPQQAVEVPRFCSLSFSSSTFPHATHPNRLLLEAPIDIEEGRAITARGHKAERWPTSGPDYFTNVSCLCAVIAESTGVLKGAADPRRPGYALGW